MSTTPLFNLWPGRIGRLSGCLADDVSAAFSLLLFKLIDRSCRFTAPYFINPASLNWGPKYGYIWVPSCLIAAAFVWFCLPEVKGRTLEEIDEMFEKRLPARKFRTYVCTGRAALESMHRNATTFEMDTGPKSKSDVIETIERIQT